MGSSGRLELVATPIGNLGDVSDRARKTFASADLICCEDTRRTRELLSHLGITGKELMSLHAHNELQRVPQILVRLQDGQNVALASDSGMPSLSDPGSLLVRACAEAGVTVSAVPGPSALLDALVLSAFDTSRFCFEGFVPRRGSERRRRLEIVAGEQRTSVIFEAPGRLVSTLSDLREICGGQRKVAVCRELTKIHEDVWRGSLDEALAAFSAREARGEVVVVVSGAAPGAKASPAEVRHAMSERLQRGDSVRDAASAVAKELKTARSEAYRAGLEAKENL